MMKSRILATALAAAALGACDTPPASPAQAQDVTPALEMARGDARDLSTDFRAATNRVLPAVVRVDVVSLPTTVRGNSRRMPQLPFPLPFDMPDMQPPGGQMQAGTGSGFVFDPSGLVMTNRHVVDGADRVMVRLSDGQEFSASVVGADPNTDVAVIQLDLPEGQTLTAAALGSTDEIGVGDWVLALGSPLGLDFSVTAGIVSALGRSIGILAGEGDAPLEAFIQTDAAINKGNSGGPLVDLDGRVIGINTAIESPTGYYAGYGFAVPIDVARKVANDLVEFGEVRRPRLGVQVADVTAADAKVFDLPSMAGAVARGVQAGTPAERAGMEMGDVIVALDGQPVQSAADLTASLARRRPDDEVTLGIVRYGKRLDMDVKLEQFNDPATRRASARSNARGDDLLGFDVRAITPELARQMQLDAQDGVVITEVAPMSAAAAAGVRPGQVLKSINGRDVTSSATIDRVRDGLKTGDPVSVVIGNGDNDVILNFIARR